MIPALAALSWEELEALGLCECGQSSDPDLHSPLPLPKPVGRSRGGHIVERSPLNKPLRIRRPAVELDFAMKALAEHGGHRGHTATALGISEVTLHTYINRAKAQGIEVAPARRGLVR